jgi:hypothetical protein
MRTRLSSSRPCTRAGVARHLDVMGFETVLRASEPPITFERLATQAVVPAGRKRRCTAAPHGSVAFGRAFCGPERCGCLDGAGPPVAGRQGRPGHPGVGVTV